MYMYLYVLHPFLQDIPSSSDDETNCYSLDVSLESHSADDSVYVPTPERMVSDSRKKFNNCSIKHLLYGLDPVGQVHEAGK